MNLTRWALVAVVLLVACAGKDTVSDSFDDQAMTDVADDVLDVNEEVQDLDIVQDIQNDLGDIQDASDLAGDDVAGDELGDDLGDELGDDLDDLTDVSIAEIEGNVVVSFCCAWQQHCDCESRKQ